MIGQKIKVIREKKRITQKDLAETLGVSRQAVCMWESGKRELRIATLDRIANALSVPISTIIGGGIMVRKGEKKVRFEFKAPTARRVLLVGDFNAWNNAGVALKRSKDGIWSIDLGLKPGKYQYKYIVDGQWKTDPSNRISVRNPFGSENSIKEVA